MDATNPAPEKPVERKPFQFQLKHLFILTLTVTFILAGELWLGIGGGCLVLFVVISVLFTWENKPCLVVTILGCMMVVMLMLPVISAISTTRTPEHTIYCQSKLRIIALALHLYESDYGSLPPAYIADENGKPMHSWRVLILPYLDQQALYDIYDFNQPWNSPRNSYLADKIPELFTCSTDTNAPGKDQTSYLAIVGAETAWPGPQGSKSLGIPDGASNTLLLVEVADSGIHWMEPRDLDFSKMKMQINPKTGRGISSHHLEGANVAFADGTVRWLPDSISSKTLRALITANGGEPTPNGY